MPPLQMLGFVLGASFASGLNLYATVATLGLLQRYEVIRLPQSLEVLAHPVVLGVAITLYLVEFVADKIPWFDTVWDAIHTFIRPPAAALLAFTAVGAVPDAWKVAAALIAGTVALTSHGTKASTRAAANTSPEPVSNWLLSFTEDAVAIGLAWLAAVNPVLTFVLVLALLAVCAFLLWKLFGLLRCAWQRAFRRTQSTPAR